MKEKSTVAGASASSDRPLPHPLQRGRKFNVVLGCLIGLVVVLSTQRLRGQGLPFTSISRRPRHGCQAVWGKPVYGQFPKPDDPFRFLPCTNETLPPPVDDSNHEKTWAALYNPDPSNWIWQHPNTTVSDESVTGAAADPYAGRGIYLCGYLDVPLDYTNKSDTRISRLAINKYQVSGLARADGSSPSYAGRKSERTIIVEPGGPGGSGTSTVFRRATNTSQAYSDNQYDVLGFDPRGVNSSQPSISCFPYNADRDRWSLLNLLTARASIKDTMAHLELLDAMNEAVFRACWERHGDMPRFLTTTFVARDVEEIRKALDEPDVTGYWVSYGTNIGQIYTNMFPSKVGRLVLDGVASARDDRELGGFSRAALDNITDAWRDGFLGECVHMGPDHCALAKPVDGKQVTLHDLEARMDTLMASLAERPVPGYTNSNGPTLITYAALNSAIFGVLYSQSRWPDMAQLLYDLEQGNSTTAAEFMNQALWNSDPSLPPLPKPILDSAELMNMVVCSDSYDAPQPPSGLQWWDSLWEEMVETAWIGGDANLFYVLPCRHFTKFWPHPAEVYRGDFNNTLKNPILLVSETHDPATPIANGRKVHAEMGRNSRLVVHHGYGHSSQMISDCTDAAIRNVILHGVVPDEDETHCYAEKKPYR